MEVNDKPRPKPKGVCSGAAECFGKDAETCARMQKQEGKCTFADGKRFKKVKASIKMTIKNVNFNKLDKDAKDDLKTGLQTKFAKKADVAKEKVTVELSAGSVKVDVQIDITDKLATAQSGSGSASADIVQDMKQSLATDDVQRELLTVVKSIDGVKQAADGEIDMTKPETGVTAEVEDIPTTTTTISALPKDVHTTTTRPKTQGEMVSSARRSLLSESAFAAAAMFSSLFLFL